MNLYYRLSGSVCIVGQTEENKYQWKIPYVQFGVLLTSFPGIHNVDNFVQSSPNENTLEVVN